MIFCSLSSPRCVYMRSLCESKSMVGSNAFPFWASLVLLSWEKSKRKGQSKLLNDQYFFIPTPDISSYGNIIKQISPTWWLSYLRYVPKLATKTSVHIMSISSPRRRKKKKVSEKLCLAFSYFVSWFEPFYMLFCFLCRILACGQLYVKHHKTLNTQQRQLRPELNRPCYPPGPGVYHPTRLVSHPDLTLPPPTG